MNDFIVLKDADLYKRDFKNEVDFSLSVDAILRRLQREQESGKEREVKEFKNWPRIEHVKITKVESKEKSMVIELGENKTKKKTVLPTLYTASVFHDQAKNKSYVEIKWKEEEKIIRHRTGTLESDIEYSTRIVNEIVEARKRLSK